MIVNYNYYCWPTSANNSLKCLHILSKQQLQVKDLLSKETMVLHGLESETRKLNFVDSVVPFYAKQVN